MLNPPRLSEESVEMAEPRAIIHLNSHANAVLNGHDAWFQDSLADLQANGYPIVIVETVAGGLEENEQELRVLNPPLGPNDILVSAGGDGTANMDAQIAESSGATLLVAPLGGVSDKAFSDNPWSRWRKKHNQRLLRKLIVSALNGTAPIKDLHMLEIAIEETPLSEEQTASNADIDAQYPELATSPEILRPGDKRKALSGAGANMVALGAKRLNDNRKNFQKLPAIARKPARIADAMAFTFKNMRGLPLTLSIGEDAAPLEVAELYVMNSDRMGGLGRYNASQESKAISVLPIEAKASAVLMGIVQSLFRWWPKKALTTAEVTITPHAHLTPVHVDGENSWIRNGSKMVINGSEYTYRCVRQGRRGWLQRIAAQYKQLAHD